MIPLKKIYFIIDILKGIVHKGQLTEKMICLFKQLAIQVTLKMIQ